MIKKIKVYSHSRNMNLGTLDSFGLGVTNDNEYDELYFEFDKMIEGQASLLTSLKDDNDDPIAFPLTAEEDGYSLVVTNQMLTTPGYEIQIQVTNGEVVWHSKIYKVQINPCLEAGTGEMPTAVEVWLVEADEKIYEITQAIAETENLDIDETKEGNISTVTITKKDGSTKSIEIVDAMPGPKGDKGDKGDPGAIKMVIVNELPATGEDDTIYLVPYAIITVQELPSVGVAHTIYIVSSTNKRYVYESNQWIEISSDNRYIEYIYVNNKWEELGRINVEVDLTDYVKNTDYATSSKGGVVKVNDTDYGIGVNGNGYLYGANVSYTNYNTKSNNFAISKGTLENVITGKGLTTKSYVDGLVGDINDALDLLNGEII